MSDIAQTIGNNIKALRKEQGETQEQLADALYIAKSRISDFENGKSVPSTEQLISIVEYYNVSFDRIISTDIIGSTFRDIQLDLEATINARDRIVPFCYLSDKNNDEYFIKGYSFSKKLRDASPYKPLKQNDVKNFPQNYNDAIDSYCNSFDKFENADALVNMIWTIIWIFQVVSLDETTAKTLKKMLSGIPVQDVPIKPHQWKEVMQYSRSTEREESKKEFVNEHRALIINCLGELKKTSHRELAEYLTAMCYLIGVLKNKEYPDDISCSFGGELLLICVEQENPFAKDYISFLISQE